MVPGKGRLQIMTVEGSGFYHDPPLWVGSSPIDEEAGELEDFDSLTDVVYRATLPCSVDIRVTREGVFAFGFHSWELEANPAAPRTYADPYDEEVRAILTRTVFMNAFLALLYTNSWCDHRMMVTPESAIYLGDIDDPGLIM